MPPTVAQKTNPSRDGRAEGMHSVVLGDDRARSSDRDLVFYGEDL